jgi:UDP-N-acetylmuramoyl-L-alanyl-D-glutamate--2,6-diaminopimelate ligase
LIFPERKNGMRLNELLFELSIPTLPAEAELTLTGLTDDTRRLEPGYLFVCQRGSNYDGHDFLQQAAEKGAVAAIVERVPDDRPASLPLILVKSIDARFLKDLGGAYYDYPDRKLKLIGIVGTKGKTTSTFLVKSILEAAGHRVGLVGTVTNLVGDEPLETGEVHNTTPGILELQRLFAKMAAAGAEYVVMEVSSHAIHQQRITGLSFCCGLFTNITRDHLDYHGTFAEYLRVKSQFFIDLPETARAAINADDPSAAGIIAQTTAKVCSYAIDTSADIRAEAIQLSAKGVSLQVIFPQGKIGLDLKLVGKFNVYNALGAFATGLALGIAPEKIKAGLEGITGVPGRFQPVAGDWPFGVIVDYAHTPDSLANILRTGRELAGAGHLILVFGCGGDRDRGKRPLMGEIAAGIADYTIITSDNPRSEEPRQIIDEIETGFREATSQALYHVETDRAAAIGQAINKAAAGDLVIIAGKGHETYQIFADRTSHFDDREAALAALKERFHG